MRIRRNTAMLAAAALLISLVGATAAETASAAGTTPSYYPDAGSIGTVTLYNAVGSQITSGSLSDSPLATYYKASGPKTGAFANNSGFVTYYTPQDGIAPQSWTTADQWTSGQNYTTAQASYPAGLNDPSTNVVVKGSATDGPFSGHIANFPSASVNDPGVYQIRLFTSAQATTYYTADIKVSGTTWSQVYPTVVTGTATTTTLAVSPTPSVNVGDAVTLTATVGPTGAVGAVQFYDGSTPIGLPVALTNDVASTTTSTLTTGVRSLTATFVPTDSTVWVTSTSTASTLSVLALATTTALSSNRAGTVLPGTTAKLTATITPNTVAGRVQFYDGVAAVGVPVVVAAGTAVLSSTGVLARGSHSFRATFVPTLTSYASSTSSTIAVKVAKRASAVTAVLAKVKVKGKARLALVTVVRATGLLPTGKVAVYRLVGKRYVKIGLVSLSRGKVVIVLPVLKRGVYYFKLAYAGSAQLLASTRVVRVKA